MQINECDIIRYNFPMQHVSYPRPCVVIRVKSDGTLTIIPISTKKYGIEDAFLIDPSDEEFNATGLEVASYIYGHPVLNISPSDVIKRLGELTGSIKARFVKWNG
ncbi:MAG: hypothetical protein WCT04_03465 [Planctomycetota bacterium]